jgi:hypothetical protein
MKSEVRDETSACKTVPGYAPNYAGRLRAMKIWKVPLVLNVTLLTSGEFGKYVYDGPQNSQDCSLRGCHR